MSKQMDINMSKFRIRWDQNPTDPTHDLDLDPTPILLLNMCVVQIV